MLRSLVIPVFCLVVLSTATLSQSISFARKQVASHGFPSAQADLNGDGILDIVNPGNDLTRDKNGFFVELSNPNGSYQAPVFYTSPYQGNSNSVVLGDFNGDGRVDVAEVEDTSDYYIFLNAGNGQLQSSWNFATTPGWKNDGIAAADFNRDGKLDLVLAEESNGVVRLQILLGKGNGTFAAPLTFDGNAKGGRLLIGDFDGDGKADLATAAGVCSRDVGCLTNVRVYYGDGNGGFSQPVAIDYPTEDYYFMVSSDIDQDGHSDLIGTSGFAVAQPIVRILHGTSNRSFDVQDVSLAKGLLPGFVPVDVADVSGDGIMDLAVIEDNPNGSSVEVLTGTSGGSYAPEQSIYATTQFLQSLSTGRYNSDTKPDLMASYALDGSHYNTNLEFLRNTTKGGSFPSCAPPKASSGIAVCSPQNGSQVASPVRFRIGAAFTSPLRKTEVWIDGVKVKESFNSYATYSFLDGRFSLAKGLHRADIYSAAFDNRLQHQVVNFTVGTSNSLQYDVSLFPGVGQNGTPQGQVTVDTSGVTTIQLNHGNANTTYTVEFCPAPGQLYPNCFTVGSVTSDGSGVVNSTVPFPVGSWAGDFELVANGTPAFSTSLIQGVASTYFATLQLDSTVNGKGTWYQGGPPPAQDPLQTGSVNWMLNGQLKFQLMGAKPNTGYYASQCPIFRGSDCYGVQQPNGNFIFTTDQNGDVSYSAPPGTNIPEDIFYVDDYATGFGFIAGFSVP